MKQQIIVYGTTWCPDVRFARRQLDQAGRDYEFIDIDENAEAELKVLEWNDGKRRVPTIVIEDGERRVLRNPGPRELARAIREGAA